MLDSRLAGNAPLKAAVAEMRRTGRMGHSLLLVGETGLGAGFAARCIAADLLYPAGGAPAEALLRGECCAAVSQQGEREGRIETGLVREAIAVSASGAADTIRVGQIRAVRNEIYHSGLSAEGRVVLLYGAEKLRAEAANALLKVLEEPPDHVTFLLTASSLAGVLPTVRSRCYSLTMAPVPLAECIDFCAAQGVAGKEARLLARVFGGSVGTVLAVSRDAARRARLEDARTLAAAAAAGDGYETGRLLAGYEKDKPGALELLADLSALAGAALQDGDICPLPPAAAGRVIRTADGARQRLRANGSPKLVLAAAAASLAAAGARAR